MNTWRYMYYYLLSFKYSDRDMLIWQIHFNSTFILIHRDELL